MALSISPKKIVESGKYPLLAKHSSWERVPLADVAAVQNGFPFESRFFDRDEGTQLIRIRDVGRVGTEHRYRGEYDPEFLVNPRDILVGMDGDFRASRWKGAQGLLNQRVCRIASITSLFDEHFLLLCLQPFLNAINAETSSVTVKHLSSRSVEDIPLPLPPLREQRRIVAKIEELFSELDKGVEALTTAREQLKAYRQSVLKHAFEGKLSEEWRGTNPFVASNRVLEDIAAERRSRKKKAPSSRSEKRDEALHPQVLGEWTVDCLGNLNIEVFDGPFGSNLKTSDYVESGVRVIRLENIGYGHFIDEKRSFVSEKKYEAIQKHTVVPGDIVFSSFVIDAIRSALVPSNISFAVNKADCFGVRFFGKTVNAKFIQFFFQSRKAFKQIEGMIHGVGRPRINTTQLKEMLIPICSPVEQAIIVERLESIFSDSDSFEATLDTGLAQIVALRQSILKQAFSGQLVAQDPTDEPASVLLERIRAEREKTDDKKPGRKTKSTGTRKTGKRATA